MSLRKAAEQALEALEDIFGKEKKDVGAINALRQALAQPEQEPVDWEAVAADQAMTIAMMKIENKKEWVGLTDEEAHELWESTDSNDDWELMKRTEAKLKEKNNA